MSDPYVKRFEALQAHIAALKAKVEEVDLPRKTVFTTLLGAFETFAKEHFNFFANGLTLGNAEFQLLPSEKYPRDYVLRQVLLRLGNDLNVIQQCIEPRIIYPVGTTIGDTLAKADRIACAALQPAVDAGIFDQITAVTYFQRKPSIRVIPYASVALIGIPYTCVSEVRDFMAIPHEAGHFVYNNGKNKHDPLEHRTIGESLSKTVEKTDRWLQNWNEELFADVYGAYVGGAAVALSFQELDIESSLHEFLMDDGEHPTPAIRPYIYARAIEKTNYDTLSQLLINKWEKPGYRPVGDPGVLFLLDDSGTARAETFDQVKQNLNSIVDTILEQYLRADTRTIKPKPLAVIQNQAALVASASARLEGVGGDTGIEQLYAEFDQNVGGLVVDLDEVPAVRVWRTWVGQKDYKVNYWDGIDTKIPKEEWLKVLEAGGWTTEGPHAPTSSSNP